MAVSVLEETPRFPHDAGKPVIKINTSYTPVYVLSLPILSCSALLYTLAAEYIFTCKYSRKFETPLGPHSRPSRDSAAAV